MIKLLGCPFQFTEATDFGLTGSNPLSFASTAKYAGVAAAIHPRILAFLAEIHHHSTRILQVTLSSESDPANYKQISLLDVVYKIYAVLL